MLIFPAIDIYKGQAVRLYKGDYNQMTVYGNPLDIANDFLKVGAKNIHIVDLEGAKVGSTPNFEYVCKIKENTGLFCEIGGGIRSIETIEKYINAGIDRVIIGTAALNDNFLKSIVEKFGEKIAVAADVLNGNIAVKGWLENSNVSINDFLEKLVKYNVKTVIVTDISKDGTMTGTNRGLYSELINKYDINITASGGVSTLDDIKALNDMNMYAAIIGKAYYNGSIDLAKAIEVEK
ncbi:MAG: 1-(5-phosphoribosyl)-5-[(5-phosphoribosylamino)methylideneamino]imidazole-4-carboxamide isomerase [Clostridia bacterium]|nr:1-(5-phosphoribosyl)-5-[(5-phosphoribosylamino)methylideneamino]imidazole-4-carboxamide isomerase [Clostridia bacterium]